MFSESLRLDFNQLKQGNPSLADFMIFIRDHKEAQLFLLKIDNDYSFLNSMSDEAIRERYFQEDNNYSIENGAYAYAWDSLDLTIEEEDDEEKSSRRFGYGLKTLLRFNFGVPSVCDLMIGNEIENNWLHALQDRKTGNDVFDIPLNEYKALIDCETDYDDIKTIIIKLPFEQWDIISIKALYTYVSNKFCYLDRSATYTYGYDNNLSGVKIRLSNTLYSIFIYTHSDIYSNDDLIVKIIAQKQNDDSYKAINTLISTPEEDSYFWAIIKDISQNHKPR